LCADVLRIEYQILSENRITRLIQPLVEDLGYEFVGLEHSSNPKNSLLRVYIDHVEGIDLDDCSKVSRELAALLDVEDPIPGHYNLEISSPGLDRPLFTPEQFEQFAGEEAKVTLFSPEQGRRKFRGSILSVQGETVRLNVDGVEVALNIGNIAKARLVPDFDGLLAARNQKTEQTGQ
jgi:ribosome maturation factor RimP